MNMKTLIIDDEFVEFERLKTCFDNPDSILPEEYSEMAKAVDPLCEGEGVQEYVKRLVAENYQDIGLILCDIARDNGKDTSWGPEVIESIRGLIIPEYPDWATKVPIIALTQYADKNIQVGIIGEKKADFVLSKPKTEIEKTLLKELILKCITDFEKFIIMNKKEKVFIVHGHDVKVKETVARFLEGLGLDVIILHEKPDDGATIIEKIEHYSDVSYAVVLYTGCDMGKEKNEDDYKPRARQNVVFEHGYMISKLGREKVCALVDKDVVCPGDLSGIVFVPLDEGGAWKMKLFQKMNSVGVEIDKDRLLKRLL